MIGSSFCFAKYTRHIMREIVSSIGRAIDRPSTGYRFESDTISFGFSFLPTKNPKGEEKNEQLATPE